MSDRNGIEIGFHLSPGFSVSDIESDSEVLKVLLTQLAPALRRVAECADRMLQGGDAVDLQKEQALLLSYSGICVSFIWTNTNRQVGKDLQRLLNASPTEPTWLREMRNSFMHVDERIMEAFERDPSPKLSIWGTGSPDPTRANLFGFEQESGTLYSMNKSGRYVRGDLRELRDQFAEMAESANDWFFFILLGAFEDLRKAEGKQDT